MNDVLFLFLYFKYLFVLYARCNFIARHSQSFCKVLFWKVA